MQTAINIPSQFDAIIDAPFGAVGVFIFNEQVSIELLTEKQMAKSAENKTAQSIANQIIAYFNNVNHDFKLPINQHGTPFQHRVWQAISAIPRGQVLTYAQIATQIGSGPRAVAMLAAPIIVRLLCPVIAWLRKMALADLCKATRMV